MVRGGKVMGEERRVKGEVFKGEVFKGEERRVKGEVFKGEVNHNPILKFLFPLSSILYPCPLSFIPTYRQAGFSFILYPLSFILKNS